MVVPALARRSLRELAIYEMDGVASRRIDAKAGRIMNSLNRHSLSSSVIVDAPPRWAEASA
jgi:hypothetical protein